MADIDKELIVRKTIEYKHEAEDAKYSRMQQNRLNFQCYHMKQDYSHKREGQSMEFMPKMSMAVEQTANFIQQGLVDIGEWFSVQAEPGKNEDAMLISPSEIFQLTKRQLNKCGFIQNMNESAKLGLIGSLMIAKVHGNYVNKPRYVVRQKLEGLSFKKKLVKIEDKAWELKVDLVRQEDYYPDPTGNGLYELEDIYMDYYQVVQLSEGKDAIFDKEVVALLKNQTNNEQTDEQVTKSNETNQNIVESGYRNRIKITECWGNIISDDGELLYENCVWAIANDRYLIRPPEENPLWHGKSPYVAAPILRVPKSVWHRSLMDAPTMLNRVLNEMINLILDGGMMSVHGIKQIHEHWMEDPSQVDDGISPGDTLRANSACPPGAKVLDRVDTSTIPQDGLAVLNLIQQEFHTSALSSDLRMGVQPFRAVKATEVVESSQTITAMLSGIAKNIEDSFIKEILKKSWTTIAQHIDDLDSPEVEALVGKKRAKDLVSISNEELFADTVAGLSFEVFGLTQTLNKQKDFTKLQALLQTISGSDVLLEEFVKKYDFGKLLGEIMRSLDINTARLKPEMEAEPGVPSGMPMPGESPNIQSQIPQAGAMSNQSDLTAEAGIPQTEFPASRATTV